MGIKIQSAGLFLLVLAAGALAGMSCERESPEVTPEPTQALAPTKISAEILPTIAAVDLDRTELPRYESLEVIVAAVIASTSPPSLVTFNA